MVACFGNELAFDVSFHHGHVAEIVYLDEVGPVSYPELADVQTVVLHRIAASNGEHVKNIIALADGALHEEVYVPA
jgi:hypothetical protein